MGVTSGVNDEGTERPSAVRRRTRRGFVATGATVDEMNVPRPAAPATGEDDPGAAPDRVPDAASEDAG